MNSSQEREEQNRLEVIFRALREGAPVREIDRRLRQTLTEERGNVSVELAIMRISPIERVERVEEVPRRSDDDTHGRDLQVFFVHNDPIDSVYVEVKSSPAGVDDFRQRAAEHLRLQYGYGKEVDVESKVDELYASERRIVVNARDNMEIFYQDFYEQLDRIVDYQRTHASDLYDGESYRAG